MLYILATPIGNMSDLTDRAKETLQKVNLIIAENPLHSKKILDHLGLGNKKYVQFAEHNETEMLSKVIELLKTQDGILMSDAGTPAISDPGFKLVRETIREGIEVTPIPGANAAVAALSASGLPTDRSIFLGFVPKTEVKLIREIENIMPSEATIVFYESPHRILKTVQYIANKWPKVNMVIAREMTKLHEEFIRGNSEEVLKELQDKPSIKGEITVLLSFK